VNYTKSVLVRLNPEAAEITDTHGFTAVKINEMCRYLGIQVGRRVSQAAVWKLTTAQVEKRLAMASIKTHSVTQRVRLAAAIIIPKLCFIGRHHWPSVAVLQGLDARIRNFVWTGLFVETVPAGARAQHWVNKALANLTTNDGGLGLPNIELELHTLATQVVLRWAYEPAGVRDMAARLLNREGSPIQTGLFLAEQPKRPRILSSLCDTGRQAIGWMYGQSMSYPTQVLIRDGIQALQADADWRWWRGEYERDYGLFHRIGGGEILRLRELEGGRMCPRWIQHISITIKCSAILHPDGTCLRLSHLRELGPGTRVADYVSWSWVRGRTFGFDPHYHSR
jgi:hypothetical protein